jgi:hypothetical protein
VNRLRKITLTAFALETLGAAYWLLLLPRLRRWGAPPEEVSRPLPGDALVPDAIYTTTHAITVRAAAGDVWPWLVQIGQNRGGFYSYDVLENLANLDIHSADHIHPEWQHLEVGADYMSLDPDGHMKLTVRVLEQDRAFVVRSGAPDGPPQVAGDLLRGELAWSWGFYLEPARDDVTRLVIRTRAAWRPTTAAAFGRVFGLEPVHSFMEIGMLRGIRRRAERVARNA